jgi:hypothetical protein
MVTEYTGPKAFADQCLYELVLVCEFYPTQFICTFQIQPVCVLRERGRELIVLHIMELLSQGKHQWSQTEQLEVNLE